MTNYSNLQGAYKRIKDYSEAELDATIAVLAAKLPNAYEYLNFIDAYFERRDRRNPPELSADSFGPSIDGE